MTVVIYLMHAIVCLKICLFAPTAPFYFSRFWDPRAPAAFFCTVASDLVLSLRDYVFKICLCLHIGYFIIHYSGVYKPVVFWVWDPTLATHWLDTVYNNQINQFGTRKDSRILKKGSQMQHDQKVTKQAWVTSVSLSSLDLLVPFVLLHALAMLTVRTLISISAGLCNWRDC